MTKIERRNYMTVQTINVAADDKGVVHSARVSTQGEMTLAELAVATDGEIAKSDKGLINFLMRDHHGSPFEHNLFTFFVRAPIFVFREFQRHRIGVSINEESGRYRQLHPVFWVPSPERKLVQVGKVGAYTFEEGSPEQHEIAHKQMLKAYNAAYKAYEEMLAAGIAREVARAVLPVGLYSSMYATFNARSLMHFLTLRTSREEAAHKSTPQREIEQVAELMEAVFQEAMPIVWEAYNRHGRIDP